MRRSILSIIILILCAALAVGVMTVFSACGQKDDGTWMKCHTAQMYIFYTAMAMTVLSAITVFLKNKCAMIGLYLVNTAAAVIAMLIPGKLTSMCMTHTMRCYTVMKPFVMIICVCVIVLCIAGSISAIRRKENVR